QNAVGQVMMLNQQGLMITGYSADEIVGQPFSDLVVSRQDSPLKLIQARDELRTGHRDLLRMDMGLRCKNGEQRMISWFHSRLAVRSLGDGEVLSVGHDVTEREQAEQQLA